MTTYKDPIDVVAHNFNTSVLTFNGEHNAEGLDMIEFDLDEEEVTTQAVASGAAMFVENPIKTGTIKFSFLESSATTDWLFGKVKEGKSIRIDFADSNAPNLNCQAKFARAGKKPPVKRDKDATVVEWNFVSTYLDMQSGSYRLEEV